MISRNFLREHPKSQLFVLDEIKRSQKRSTKMGGLVKMHLVVRVEKLFQEILKFLH